MNQPNQQQPRDARPTTTFGVDEALLTVALVLLSVGGFLAWAPLGFISPGTLLVFFIMAPLFLRHARERDRIAAGRGAGPPRKVGG